MADIYFSKLGNDTTGDGSQLNPYLTLTKCLTVATTGQTIEGADGTYAEASFVQPVDTNLTINAENRHGAIIQGAGGTRVMHVTASGTGLTLGEIVLDAENAQSDCLTTGTSESSLTFSGTKFLNPTAEFIDSAWHSNITMNGNWLAEADSLTSDGFRFANANATAGIEDISDGTMTVLAFTGNLRGIMFDPQVTGVSGIVNNVTLNLTSTNNITGIYSSGLADCAAYSNTVNMLGSGTHTGISLLNDALDIMDTCNVYDNTVTGASSAGGLGILIGKDADTDANANRIIKPKVYGNTINKFNHGILLGHITDGKVYSNSANDNVLGIVLKVTTTCKATGNVVADCTGSGGLRFKGDTDSVFANNLVTYANGSLVSSAVAIYADAAGATNSTGCGAYNNLVYADETIADWVVVAVASTCTFNSNNYYSTATGDSVMGTNPFNYQGTGRADLATWISAEATVTGETETDPVLVNNVPTVVSLMNGGFNWGDDMYLMEDFNGYPFPAYDISVGMVQTADNVANPFAPPNL